MWRVDPAGGESMVLYSDVKNEEVSETKPQVPTRREGLSDLPYETGAMDTESSVLGAEDSAQIITIYL